MDRKGMAATAVSPLIGNDKQNLNKTKRFAVSSASSERR